MKNIFQAYGRALRSLCQPDIFWHMLWPGLLSILAWFLVLYFFWTDITGLLIRFVQAWPLVGGWVGNAGTVQTTLEFFIHLLLIMLAIPLVFFTSVLLISALALPLMLDRVSATDYTDLAQHHAGTMTGSVINSVVAAILFIILAIVTLPLWLIPGVGMILSILLSAWMNQRCYRYDALMNHADKDEFKKIPTQHSAGLYMLGVAAGLMAFIPIVNFFVPALTGLAFVHYLLEALRHDRTEKFAMIAPNLQRQLEK